MTKKSRDRRKLMRELKQIHLAILWKDIRAQYSNPNFFPGLPEKDFDEDIRISLLKVRGVNDAQMNS